MTNPLEQLKKVARDAGQAPYPGARALMDEARSRVPLKKLARAYDAENELASVRSDEAWLQYVDMQIRLFRQARGRAPANVEELEVAIQTEPEMKRFATAFGKAMIENPPV
jgi:hypothetical protein